jgi:ferric-dicitrate binding protein FerR (iron transport regulator)
MFWLAVERSPFLYAVLTAAAGLLGLAAALKALTADPALWSSESWRYVGAILNAVGFIAAALAMAGFVRWSDRVSKWQRSSSTQTGNWT